MGRYLTPSPSAAHSRPVKHQQVFKTSGTFTPSQKLLDAGGVVTVRCVGGGGGGHYYYYSNVRGGSSGMDVTRMVRVAGPVTVTIGAGGHIGSNGGTTSFGVLLSANGGKSGTINDTDNAAGDGSQAGYRPDDLVWKGRGGGRGGGVSKRYDALTLNSDGVANTGGGGAAAAYNNNGSGGKGGSGICIVTWEE